MAAPPGARTNAAQGPAGSPQPRDPVADAEAVPESGGWKTVAAMALMVLAGSVAEAAPLSQPAVAVSTGQTLESQLLSPSQFEQLNRSQFELMKDVARVRDTDNDTARMVKLDYRSHVDSVEFEARTFTETAGRLKEQSRQLEEWASRGPGSFVEGDTRVTVVVNRDGYELEVFAESPDRLAEYRVEPLGDYPQAWRPGQVITFRVGTPDGSEWEELLERRGIRNAGESAIRLRSVTRARFPSGAEGPPNRGDVAVEEGSVRTRFLPKERAEFWEQWSFDVTRGRFEAIRMPHHSPESHTRVSLEKITKEGLSIRTEDRYETDGYAGPLARIRTRVFDVPEAGVTVYPRTVLTHTSTELMTGGLSGHKSAANGIQTVDDQSEWKQEVIRDDGSASLSKSTRSTQGWEEPPAPPREGHLAGPGRT
ncbi:MAG: hypothetical protein AB1758_20020, partial [Candidatus Eremiobacterota bacterium]